MFRGLGVRYYKDKRITKKVYIRALSTPNWVRLIENQCHLKNINTGIANLLHVV